MVPLLFLVPVGFALAASFVRLLGTAHPVYGWTMSMNVDAEAMYLGTWPFQDPAHGFTGDAYTPFYPAVVSVLNHIRLWTGWSLLLTLVSVVALMALIAWLAYREPLTRRPRSRALAIAEAAGIGALAVSFVFGLLRPAVYEARSDQFAWALACFGVALVPRAAAGSWRLRAAVVALLTAAFWAKQTAIIGSVSALALVASLVWARRLRLRPAVIWMASLAAVNAALVVLLTWLTDGWQYRFNFMIDLPVTRSVSDIAPDLAIRSAPVIAFVVVASAGAFLARDSGWKGLRDAIANASERNLLVAGFAAMALSGVVGDIYLRRFAAGDDNNLLPGIWALAALGALAYRAAGVRRLSAGIAAAGCLLIFSTTLAPGHGNWRLRGGQFVPDHHWADLPRSVDRLAARTLVWDPLLSDLNVGHQGLVFPNVLHIQEVLQRNRRPKQFERALLGRQFGAIYGYVADFQLGVHPGTAGEDNYYWKLNRVIDLKYRPAPRVPAMPGGAPYLSSGPKQAEVPRAGPDPAPWLDNCFGPFRLAGLEMQIHTGGGLWCVPAPGTLRLRETPANQTEVVSSKPVHHVSGRLQARVNPVPGGWWMVLDGGWTLRGTVATAATGLTMSIADAGGHVVQHVGIPRSALHAANGRIVLEFAPAKALSVQRGSAPTTVQVGTDSSLGGGKLHFWATQNSGAEFNLQDLHAE